MPMLLVQMVQKMRCIDLFCSLANSCVLSLALVIVGNENVNFLHDISAASTSGAGSASGRSGSPNQYYYSYPSDSISPSGFSSELDSRDDE